MMPKRVDVAEFGTVSSTMRPLPRDAAGKRCGPVEDVIAWAWREELPKMPKRPAGPHGHGLAWTKTETYGEYLSLVELYGVNRYGCVPEFSAESWPCLDAVLVAEAVGALDETTLEMPEDWRPAPELDRFDGLGARAVADAWRRMTRQDEAGATVLRLKPSELIIRHAVLGTDMGAMALDEVTRETVRWPNGTERWFIQRTVDVVTGCDRAGKEVSAPQTVEWNGWNSKSRRPMPDAYRKHYLDPDPVGAIVARAEYEILRSALDLVAGLVADRLVDVVMLPSRLPSEPWIDDGRRRVLPDLGARQRYAEAEAQAMRAAFARRYPRWFRNLERAAAKMAEAPA